MAMEHASAFLWAVSERRRRGHDGLTLPKDDGSLPSAVRTLALRPRIWARAPQPPALSRRSARAIDFKKKIF